VAVEQARVAMKGTGNWVGSDAHGLFRVQLLRSTRVGQSIEVEVEGVPGWLLYQPADGRVVVPEQPQTVTLKLLPKGSLRFLGSQGLASLLSRMMSEAKESARASPAVPLGSVPPPVDLKGPMQKWASEYGLSLVQVQTAVDKWAKEVLSRRQQDDEQVCLAKLSCGLSRRQALLSAGEGWRLFPFVSPRVPCAGVYRVTYYGTDLELLGDDEIEIGGSHIDRRVKGDTRKKID
jgi:hypothetical protein